MAMQPSHIHQVYGNTPHVSLFSVSAWWFGHQILQQRWCSSFNDNITTILQVSIDWSGTHYCGLNIKWNYKKQYVDLSMPKYIPNVLQRFALTHKPTYQHHFHFLPQQHPPLTKMPFDMIHPNLSTNKKQHEFDKSSVAYSTMHVLLIILSL